MRRVPSIAIAIAVDALSTHAQAQRERVQKAVRASRGLVALACTGLLIVTPRATGSPQFSSIKRPTTVVQGRMGERQSLSQGNTLGFSLDPVSPEVNPPGVNFDPSDVLYSTSSSVQVLIANALLGIPANLNLDAISNGEDWLFTFDPSALIPVGYTVDRLAAGLPGSVIRQQAALNEQASDVFLVISPNSGLAWSDPILWRDEQQLDLVEGPGQSNIDALVFRYGGPGTKFYYSMDFATAPNHPLNPDPSDIIYVTTGNPGGMALFATSGDLDLLPADDIDALVVLDLAPIGTLTAEDYIWVSLTNASPSANAAPFQGGSNIVQVHGLPGFACPSGSPCQILSRTTLGLAAGDELDGMFAYDPPDDRPPGTGDDCTAQHIGLPNGPSSGNAFTTGTTGTTGQSDPLCYAFGSTAIHNDVWFTWVADNTAGNATLTTCGGTSVDTKIAVYNSSGASVCPTTPALACNDDACGLQSSIQWTHTPGGVYTIQLGTFPGALGGSGTFDIGKAPIPPCGVKDDGTTENALGLTAGGEMGWIKVITCDLLKFTHIDTAYGTLMFPGSVTNGNASKIVHYTSTTGATDPNDPSWQVQTKTATVVVNGDTDILNKIEVGHKTRPSGSTTMILASADQVAGQFPGPMDQNFANPEAWVVGSTLGPGTLNTTTLSANNVPPLNMTAIGFPSTWLLRATDNDTSGGETSFAICFGNGTGDGGLPCPCGNDATALSGGGCANGPPMPVGQGAVLSSSGSRSISADDLVLTADFTTNQPGLFFQGDVTIAGGNGVSFGDGLRCCGTNVIRLEIADPTGTNGVHTTSTVQGIIATSPPGTIQPGVKQCYQWWYRNPGRSPCGANFNLSNAISHTWEL